MKLPDTDRAPIGLAAEFQLDSDEAVRRLGQALGVDLASLADAWPQIRILASDVELEIARRTVRLIVARTHVVAAPIACIEGDEFDALACDSCGNAYVCAHVLAVLAALLWGRAESHAARAPSWRRSLEPLMHDGSQVEDISAGLPQGWLRCVLADPAERRSPIWADPRAIARGMLDLRLIRQSSRTGKPLKPIAAPKSLDAIEHKVRSLPPGDRALCRAAEQRRLLGHVARFHYADSVTVADEVERLDADLFAGLADVTEVWFEDTPVRASRDPWRAEIRVCDGDAGGLRLRWSRPVRAHWPIGPGYVLTDGVVRPVADGTSGAIVSLLDEGLPEVPAADIQAFVRVFVAGAKVPIHVDTPRLPVEAQPPIPRLLLTEDDAGVRADVRFIYGAIEVPHDQPGALVESPGEAPGEPKRLHQRHRVSEKGRLDELARVLPTAPGTPFHGDAVYDFLLEGLPRLGDWEIYVDDTLQARRPRGTVSAVAKFESGVDWFDVDVRFEVGGVVAKPAAVIDSWRRGLRYVRLTDGTVARLPKAWLDRYGDAADELREMRATRRKRLGAFAAPLASQLFDAVPPTAALDRWRKIAQRLASFDGVPDRAVPPGLQATLRPYQHGGFRWLCAMRDLGLGAVLADDMGLGKTVQTLAALLDDHASGPSRPPSLVIAPTSVIYNWVDEAARFAPSLRLALHHGPRRGALPDDDQVDVVITNYALLRHDADRLAARRWRTVVLDEAQHIKNPRSAVAGAARALDADHRIALTGTPLENHLLELWSMFHCLMPGFFGSQAAFRARYATPVQRRQDAAAMAALRTRIRPFILRRLKSEVEAELPPRQEQVLHCELGPEQRRLYERVKQTYRDTVLNRVARDGIGRSAILVLEALTRLRQACCDARLVPFPEARGVPGSAKLDLLAETLEEIGEKGHRALVFSQWPSLLRLVAEDLDRAGTPYLYLDGQTRQRADLQSRWNDPAGPPVFLISLKAGGTGLNLTGADHVFHLDPWWNPAVEAQANDRAHRIGQTKPVMVYSIVARDTVEEKIIELKARKKALADAAIDTDRMVVDALTRDDLVALFTAERQTASTNPSPPPETFTAIRVASRAIASPTAPSADADGRFVPEVLERVLEREGQLTAAAVRDELGCTADEARALLQLWVATEQLERHAPSDEPFYVRNVP